MTKGDIYRKNGIDYEIIDIYDPGIPQADKVYTLSDKSREFHVYESVLRRTYTFVP